MCCFFNACKFCSEETELESQKGRTLAGEESEEIVEADEMASAAEEVRDSLPPSTSEVDLFYFFFFFS